MIPLMAGLFVVVVGALLLGLSHWRQGKRARDEALAGAALFALGVVGLIGGALALIYGLRWVASLF